MEHDGSNKHTDIRTDLWGNMSIHELADQRDLIVTKQTMLLEIINSVPAAKGLYQALQHALDDIDGLISQRTSGRNTKR